jgi:hypothetical protein
LSNYFSYASGVLIDLGGGAWYNNTWVFFVAGCVNLDEQRHRYRALDDWFKTAQGHQVGRAFALHRFDVRGDARLQLGLCGESPWLLEPVFKQTYMATPCLGASDASLIASPDYLPWHQHQFDCVIAPMMIEMFGLLGSPLDEIDRVLKPMGHVIVFGINPLSLWGGAARYHHLPYLGSTELHLHSPMRVKRALEVRGYQLKALETFYYVPPFRKKAWIKKCFFLNEMGKMMTLFPAGFYYLIMQKYTPCTPDVVQRARRVPLLLPG